MFRLCLTDFAVELNSKQAVSFNTRDMLTEVLLSGLSRLMCLNQRVNIQPSYQLCISLITPGKEILCV